MCDLKISAIQQFLLLVASILPQTPTSLTIPYIVSQINANAPWNLGGLVLELFSASYEFLVLLISWKFVTFLLPMLISKI